MAVSRAEVLGSYRYVMRAVRATFQQDAVAVRRSREAARAEFLKHRGASGAALRKLVDDARDAADFLRSSIVQARLSPSGRYEMKLRAVEDGTRTVSVQPAAVQGGGAEAKEDACCGGAGHSHG
jgi:complex III assembly factor LYRM7